MYGSGRGPGHLVGVAAAAAAGGGGDDDSVLGVVSSKSKWRTSKFSYFNPQCVVGERSRGRTKRKSKLKHFLFFTRHYFLVSQI